MDHLCIWFLGKKSCPPGSSPPILLEITLLQLHCNRTKKHLVLNGNANFHMATFCGWGHLASCLQSSSPHSQMVTSQRPTLLFVFINFSHIVVWLLLARPKSVINAVLRHYKLWCTYKLSFGLLSSAFVFREVWLHILIIHVFFRVDRLFFQLWH